MWLRGLAIRILKRKWTGARNNIDNNSDNNNNNNGVLVARGGRENSNPAKTTTHSGTVEKETHYINVVGIIAETGLT